MDLHYSQTNRKNTAIVNEFESPMDLHYSQTPPISSNAPHVFESPMDLHYSQTPRRDLYFRISLNPLWIYTTLKHRP